MFHRFGLFQKRSEILNIFFLLFYVTFPLSLAAGAFISKEKEESVYLASTTIAVGIQVAKLLYIIWRSSEILTFISQFGSIVTANHEEFYQVNKKLGNLLKIGNCIVSIGTTTFIFLFYTVSQKKALPFNIGFPLDWKNSEIGYWVTFAFILVQFIYSVVIYLLNFIIWYLLLTFSINYELLVTQIKRMGAIKETPSGTDQRKFSPEEKQKFYYKYLILVIGKHQTIGQTIDQFQSCFSNLFLIQIASSGMGICGAVFTLAFSSHKNIFLSMGYVCLLIDHVFDIFMIMYLANEITLSSGQLLYCLFESNWLEQSESCKKCLIILTELLKRPYELVVGVIYPLNLETFTRILNLAYMMFNILQNLNF